MAKGSNGKVGNDANYSKRTGKLERMGHTAGPYGNDPAKNAKGEANKAPRDLIP